MGLAGEGDVEAEEGEVEHDGDQGCEEKHEEKGRGEEEAEHPQQGEGEVDVEVRGVGGDEHTLLLILEACSDRHLSGWELI